MISVPFSFDFLSGDTPRYAPGRHGFVTERERDEYPALEVTETNSGLTVPWWYKGTVLTGLEKDESGVKAVPTADVRRDDLKGRSVPLWYKADTGPGRFKIRVTLTGTGDGDETLVFVSRRRLAWRGRLQKGQSVAVTALCDVSPIVAVGGGDAAAGDLGRAEDMSVDVVIVGAALRHVRMEPWEGRMMFLMGDSTVTDQTARIPYAPGETYAGWGQMLQSYLGLDHCVSNHAHSGLSTETFREKGHYALMMEQVGPRDTVLIQFGHNDQKRLHLAADKGYRDNLIRFIGELRAVGAVPILVTPLARNTWSSETEYNDMLAPFAGAMKRIGHELAVPVVDLHEHMKDAITSVGMEKARVWFHPCDYTHTNDFGAFMAAGFVAGELRAAGIISGSDQEPWEVRPPLDGLMAPPEEELHGLKPPAGEKPLVDYGLIPGAPWPIT